MTWVQTERSRQAEKEEYVESGVVYSVTNDFKGFKYLLHLDNGIKASVYCDPTRRVVIVKYTYINGNVERLLAVDDHFSNLRKRWNFAFLPQAPA